MEAALWYAVLLTSLLPIFLFSSFQAWFSISPSDMAITQFFYNRLMLRTIAKGLNRHCGLGRLCLCCHLEIDLGVMVAERWCASYMRLESRERAWQCILPWVVIIILSLYPLHSAISNDKISNEHWFTRSTTTVTILFMLMLQLTSLAYPFPSLANSIAPFLPELFISFLTDAIFYFPFLSPLRFPSVD